MAGINAPPVRPPSSADREAATILGIRARGIAAPSDRTVPDPGSAATAKVAGSKVAGSTRISGGVL